MDGGQGESKGDGEAVGVLAECDSRRVGAWEPRVERGRTRGLQVAGCRLQTGVGGGVGVGVGVRVGVVQQGKAAQGRTRQGTGHRTRRTLCWRGELRAEARVQVQEGKRRTGSAGPLSADAFCGGSRIRMRGEVTKKGDE